MQLARAKGNIYLGLIAFCARKFLLQKIPINFIKLKYIFKILNIFNINIFEYINIIYIYVCNKYIYNHICNFINPLNMFTANSIN